MRDIKSKLTARLKPSDTKERCGFITKRGRVVEVQNVAEKPEEAFKFAPKDVLTALDKGMVATWHTHPGTNGNLSGEDYSCFLNWDDLDHYIVSHGAVTKYVVEDGMVVKK